MPRIISINLDPSRDVVKLPKGAKGLGVTPVGENLEATFQVDTAAPIVATELCYPSPNEDFEGDNWNFVGQALPNGGETIICVYSREL